MKPGALVPTKTITLARVAPASRPIKLIPATPGIHIGLTRVFTVRFWAANPTLPSDGLRDGSLPWASNRLRICLHIHADLASEANFIPILDSRQIRPCPSAPLTPSQLSVGGIQSRCIKRASGFAQIPVSAALRTGSTGNRRRRV